MSDTPKRFEEWEEVDCNECARYWDSSCDGNLTDSRVGCNSYLATRSVVLPAKLKSLEKRVLYLELAQLAVILVLAATVLLSIYS